MSSFQKFQIFLWPRASSTPGEWHNPHGRSHSSEKPRPHRTMSRQTSPPGAAISITAKVVLINGNNLFREMRYTYIFPRLHSSILASRFRGEWPFCGLIYGPFPILSASSVPPVSRTSSPRQRGHVVTQVSTFDLPIAGQGRSSGRDECQKIQLCPFPAFCPCGLNAESEFQGPAHRGRTNRPKLSFQ